MTSQGGHRYRAVLRLDLSPDLTGHLVDGADYDVDAIRNDVRLALVDQAAQIAPSVFIRRDGVVLADPQDVPLVEAIDWTGLQRRIDLRAAAERRRVVRDEDLAAHD